MTRYLAHEAEAYARLKEALLAKGYDEETVEDTVEGEFSLHEMIERVLSAAEDDGSMSDALASRIASMQERKKRIEARKDARRTAVLMAMETAGLRKLEAPEFTVSVGRGAAKVVITDADALPDQYVKTERTPLKKELAAALKALGDGEDIPGAMLGNPSSTLTVKRT